MNKKVALIITGLVIVIAAGFAYVAMRPQDSPPTVETQQTGTPPPAQNTPEPSQPPAAAPGEYKEYTAQALNQSAGRRVLFFYATWCPQCRELDRTIREATLPSGMMIFKVNYDTQMDLRQKYGVTLQTTLVEIDNNGNLVKKIVAYDEPRWPAVLKELGE